MALARRAIELDPNAVLPRRALCNTLPYREASPAPKLLAALRDCSARLPRTELGPFANDRRPGSPAAVGLLSGSLKTHPVGWLTIAGFETLDPRAFDLGRAWRRTPREDSDRAPLPRHCRRLARRSTRSTTRRWRRRARDLGIDVLIDLGGYGDAARMPACAHRLAPVQVKWVGMQNHSSGLAEMDWIITDRWETPPGFEHPCTPNGCCACRTAMSATARRRYAPDVVPLPALANGHITFGCFNNLAKITPRVIATWAAVCAACRTRGWC